MSNSGAWQVLAVLLICAGCARGDDSPRPAADADIAAVNDLREQEIAAAEAGDVEALLALRTEDFVAMPPDQQPLRGKAAVRQFLSDMFEQVQLEETVVSEDVVISGDWAHDRGTFTGTVQPKAGGPSMAVDGKYLWIARQQGDGSWRYTLQMWSNNNPSM